MASPSRSDLEIVRTYFENFGLHQAPENGSPLYYTLAVGVLDDPQMLEFAAAACPPSQPAANLLFAAVHYLLLGENQHPLRDFYPDVVATEKTPQTPSAETYPLFQDFVRTHTSAIQELMQTRLVQTGAIPRNEAFDHRIWHHRLT